ncbi:MAG: flap endonuclease-1 [Candidatus Diapherotrites archaeon]|nr:flap endonuclease-1 [Candidatus Diapherotrites archaeon]
MGLALGELVEGQPVALEDLALKRLGVDSFNVIYQFVSSIRGADGTPLTDSKGNVTSHLTGLLYRTTNLIDKGIRPVFVFDGVSSEMKAKTIQKRREIRARAIAAHEQALKEGDLAKARELGSRALKVTPEMVADAKKLVSLMGLPVVEAPSEGEAQVAFMAGRGDLDGVVSQDWDSLLFGAPLLYRNLTVSGRRKVPGRNIYVEVSPERVVLEDVLAQLRIDRRKLIWLGMLIGTDFNEKFPKVGPKTALKLVQENDSFESIISKTGFMPEFDFHSVEELFLKPTVSSEYSVQVGLPDPEGLMRFLCTEHDFSQERVKGVILKLQNRLSEKGNQSSLRKWF